MMILLNQYSTEQQAYITMGMLKTNGIEAEVTPQDISSVFPAPDAGNSVYNLFVPDGQAEEAKKLLREHGDLT